MKRYIVDKAAAQILNLQTESAVEKLSESVKITDENLHFESVPYVSVMLTDEQVTELREQGIFPKEERVENNVLLGADYERLRSFYFKTQKKGITGKGAKVAVLDTGCNNFGAYGVTPVPVDFEINVADANPGITDVHGHGTRVASNIHSSIGMANGCELHFIKTLNDSGYLFESAAVAAFDYVLQNNIDFVNLSWTFWTPAVQAAIEAVIANGTVVCAASGNNGETTWTLLPASLPGVVAVNACQENGLPYYKNTTPNTLPGCHGITVACAGVASEGLNRAGGYGGGFGTSFACPVFVAALACYKEELNEPDNNKVLEYALRRAKKQTDVTSFGAGLVSF